MINEKASISARRSRGFDQQQALDRATKLFWRDGYEGTSVDEYMELTGTSRQSFLDTYGDKERLFRAVVTHYVTGPGSYVQRALERPQVAEAIRALLLDAATAFASPDHPPGCLVVHGALASGNEAAPARDLLLAERLGRQAAIKVRLGRAADEGDLPPGADPVVMTEYVMTVLHGMAVQALGGASRDVLAAVAELGLRALSLGDPEPTTPDKRGKAPSRPASKRAKPDHLAGQLAMDL